MMVFFMKEGWSNELLRKICTKLKYIRGQVEQLEDDEDDEDEEMDLDKEILMLNDKTYNLYSTIFVFFSL